VVTAVNIYRTETPGSEVAGQNKLSAVASTVSTFTDATVVNGHTYEYKIGFYGPLCTGGAPIPTDGPLSDPATVTIPTDPVVSTAPKPTGFTATVQ